MKPILLIDDDLSFRETLADTLADFGFESQQAESVRAALQLIEQEEYFAIFIDYKMPQMTGLEGLQSLKTSRASKTPVVMITSFTDANKTLQAISNGAFDYLTKPVSRTQIKTVLDQLVKQAAESSPDSTPMTDDSADTFVSESNAMREVVKRLARIAASDLPVLITGQTGTGKELVARMIHDYSPRKPEPFIALNCAAIPNDLLESELFGHTKGSFTGAVSDREGAFARARGGTVFLDEIGDLSLALQAKLLRVLQEREVTPVGSAKTIAIHARFVSATHQDLRSKVDQGEFRQDLMFRLNAAEIQLPPLSDREGDIELLAQRFLIKFAGKRLSPAALAKLKAHSWPGNVRELKNVVESSALLTPSSLIDENDVNLAPPTSKNATAATPEMTSYTDLSLPLAVAKLEQRMLEDALEKSNQNRSEAARLLGIPRQALYAKLKALGLMGSNKDVTENDV